jgi:hypothetical protein
MGFFRPTGQDAFCGAILLDPMLVATKGIYETVASVIDTTWPELVAWLRQNAELSNPSRDAVPFWSPGSFSPYGVKDEHALPRELLVLDYDGRTSEEFEHIRTAARGFASVIHTSHSHGVKEGYRFRLIVPFDRPVPVEAWAHVWRAAVAFFGVAPDGKCKNVGRWYFLPASNPAAQPCWIESNEGPCLSVDYLLSVDVGGVDATGRIVGELAQHELVSRAELGKLASKLERKKVPDIQMLGRSLKKALMGEVFAAPGYRNDTAFKLAGEIAKEFPFGNADEICAHLQQGIEATGEPSVEAFAGQIRRQQSEKQATYSERQRVNWLRRDGEEAPVVDVEGEPAVVPEGYPMIVQRDGFYWFRRKGSLHFAEMYPQKDARLAILRYMSDSINAVGLDGDLLQLDTILAEHSHPFRELEGDYLATQTTYDMGTKRLTLATAPRRPLVPRFNPDVDTWLRLMFRSGYEKAAQWIAALVNPTKAAPALYMHGPRGVGKGFLVSGLERLWYAGHTPLSETVASFNPNLQRNPLVFADEEIPKDLSLGWLRAFLTQRVRTINEKYRPQFTLKGYTRLIIGANNRNVLAYTRAGELTREDALAIGERFLPLEVYPEARSFTDTVDTDEWIARDYIAEHALYLAQTIEIPKLGRWAVEGDGESVAAELAGPRFSWLARTIVDYLATPQQWESQYSGGNRQSWQLRTHESRLWVSRAVLAPDGKKDVGDFDRAVKYMGTGNKCLLPLGSSPVLAHYWEIDLDRLIQVETPTISLEEIVGVVATSTEDRLARGNRHLRAVR